MDVKDQVQLRTAVPLDLKSVKPYKTKDEYLYAMKEDLAEWFSDLYSLPINVDNFFEHLDSGTLLCRHANTVQTYMSLTSDLNSNENALTYRQNAQSGTFQARDNISIFIGWCRKVLEIRDTLLFETEDLVARKNERNVILGILEVARKGAKFGVLAPQLIQLEQEIDEEIELEKNKDLSQLDKMSKAKLNKADLDNGELVRKKAEKKYIEVDMMSLDEMVRLILSRCKCEHQYPMIRMSEGRYTHGNDMNTIFLRVLRRHVMVRTGGGWDTLESYLDRHDPCRCNSKEHRGSLAFRNQARADNRKMVENGDGRPKSFLGSMESMRSSESSETRNRSSKNSSNRQSQITEEPSSDDITDESSTLSLLKDVVTLIETKQPVAADAKHKVTPPSKYKDRPKACKYTPSNKTHPPNHTSNGQINGPTNKKPLTNNISTPKTPVVNSKSLSSSRENINLNRRKSDFFGMIESRLPESRRSSLIPETPKAKVRPSSSTVYRTPVNSATRTPERKRILPEINKVKNASQTPSKSLNSSCENLLLNQRRRSEFVPRKITPSKSFQNYSNIADDASPKSVFKKPTNPAPRARQVTPKRPASARTPTMACTEKSAPRTRKTLDFSQCSHSLENLLEEISPLHHFQSQETVTEGERTGTTPLSKPRRDINNGLKTRIPAPVKHTKLSEVQSLKRADSGVDITGGQDFIDPTPQKNPYFDDGDYY